MLKLNASYSKKVPADGEYTNTSRKISSLFEQGSASLRLFMIKIERCRQINFGFFYFFTFPSKNFSKYPLTYRGFFYP